MLFGSVFTSCSNDDDLLLAGDTQTEQVSSLSQDSVSSYTRSVTTLYTWSEVDASTHPTGLRCFKETTKNWYIFKIYIPEIKVTPIFQVTETPEIGQPIFYKRSIGEWNSNSLGSGAHMLVNASFFKLNSLSTGDYSRFGRKATLPHKLGITNSNIVADGYDPNEYGIQYLRINSNKAYITGANHGTTFEMLVGGLDPIMVDKDSTSTIGRTMVGIPSNGNNLMYIFCTGSSGGATQRDGIRALKDYGCNLFMMLDGSGSSQAVWNGSIIVSSTDAFLDRRIPVILKMTTRWKLTSLFEYYGIHRRILLWIFLYLYVTYVYN